MWVWMLAACGSDAVPVDEVTDRWWHMEENFINIYLSTSGGPAAGALWYDFFGPTVVLEDNFYGGEWSRVSDQRFRLDYFGADYTVRAVPSVLEGCYDLHLGFLADDLACPYTGDYELPDPVDSGIGDET